MFWSLPSVISRPSAFGLNSGSCFPCPQLLVQAQVFYFCFLLRAEKPPCSVMDCHRGSVLNLLHLHIVNMSRSPGLQKTTPSDLTLLLSACGFKAKDRIGLPLTVNSINSYFPCLKDSRTDMGTGNERCTRYIAAHLSCFCMC